MIGGLLRSISRRLGLRNRGNGGLGRCCTSRRDMVALCLGVFGYASIPRLWRSLLLSMQASSEALMGSGR